MPLSNDAVIKRCRYQTMPLSNDAVIKRCHYQTISPMCDVAVSDTAIGEEGKT